MTNQTDDFAPFVEAKSRRIIAQPKRTKNNYLILVHDHQGNVIDKWHDSLTSLSHAQKTARAMFNVLDNAANVKVYPGPYYAVLDAVWTYVKPQPKSRYGMIAEPIDTRTSEEFQADIAAIEKRATQSFNRSEAAKKRHFDKKHAPAMRKLIEEYQQTVREAYTANDNNR